VPKSAQFSAVLWWVGYCAGRR